MNETMIRSPINRQPPVVDPQATMTKDMRRGIVEPLRPQSSPELQGSGQLSADLTQLEPEKIDHLVLVVSNCGCRAAQDNPDIEHDEGQAYTIEVSAV
ncbi:hypothetical protein HYR99_09925 [Candidatus Poribacteria bacterium]|nr:hypothetical protein [Candidatus Poribacteria bacterium]